MTESVLGMGPRRRGPIATLRTALALGAVFAFAILAASCGADQPRGSGPLRPPSAGGALPPSMRPNELTPEPAVDVHPVRWTRAEAVRGGLRVHATLTGGPPCTVLGRVDVDETAAEVTVTLQVGRRPNAPCDGPQAALGFPIVVAVDLHAPLGKRPVRDGAAR